jgi:hypothetical protein
MIAGIAGSNCAEGIDVGFLEFVCFYVAVSAKTWPLDRKSRTVCLCVIVCVYVIVCVIVFVCVYVQGGSNMTGSICV